MFRNDALRAALIALILYAIAAAAQEPVRVYAAGSLRAALTETAQAFEKSTGVKVALTFGASGLLAERIGKGEPAEVFASADMGNPAKLRDAGKSREVVRLAGNRLCALASPHVAVSSATLLERMLDPSVKLGISTPKADPSGDYAVQVFEKAERIRPGSYSVLMRKARQLTGGPDSPPAPANRTIYGSLVSGGQADVFLTYCTNAVQAQAEVPELRIVDVPDDLAVGADYGLTVLRDARPGAERFAAFLLSNEGQAVLARHGFSPAAAAERRTR